MLLQDGEEQDLVGVLQQPQERVLLKRAPLAQEALVIAVYLALQRIDAGRQQAVQAQQGAFLFGEGRALVEQRQVKQLETGNVRLDVARTVLGAQHIVRSAEWHLARRETCQEL